MTSFLNDPIYLFQFAVARAIELQVFQFDLVWPAQALFNPTSV